MKAKFLVSKDFKAFLKMKGLTVKKLSAELKYQEPQVSAILAGKIEPSMRFLHRAAAFTKLGIEEILETRFENGVEK